MAKRTQYNRIKEVLSEKGKTQLWLAEQLDLDYVTVSRYCNNHRQPSIERLHQIAGLLKINAKDLLN
jgi:transcriptional regulator with XRE-family HTH domain